jgi:L-galactose dehydrogenase/L-glyceraldehyde 3-phosphate reductase
MEYCSFGSTGIDISRLSFGGGPISRLMVGDDSDSQREVVEHALNCGVNWFDTAPTYGEGKSELALGKALAAIRKNREVSVDGYSPSQRIHVATKSRLMHDDLADVPGAIRRIFEGSLDRLQLSRVTLLQLHNSITLNRGDEPTSLTAEDVLRPGGILDTFRQLRDEGLVEHLGLTGIGHPNALREVVLSGGFETMQVPYNILNPSAGRDVSETFSETNYGNIIADCGRMKMGVLAIRVFAGGALLNDPPSPYTYRTPFFTLKLYERDRRRASELHQRLTPDRSLKGEAIRFALSHPHVSSALIGFGATWQIDDALATLTSKEPSLDWDVAAACN